MLVRTNTSDLSVTFKSNEKLVSHIDTNIITAKMMDAIYRSAELGKEVEL